LETLVTTTTPYESRFWVPIEERACATDSRLDFQKSSIEGLARRKFCCWTGELFAVKKCHEKKNETTRKGTDMKGKCTKGTEKTSMDRLEHELKESERQVLSAGGK